MGKIDDLPTSDPCPEGHVPVVRAVIVGLGEDRTGVGLAGTFEPKDSEEVKALQENRRAQEAQGEQSRRASTKTIDIPSQDYRASFDRIFKKPGREALN